MNASNKDVVCGICKKNFSKYTCPKCGVTYCGIPCYKSDFHADCSETFYKHEMLAALKAKNVSDDEKRNMIEILKRVEESAQEEKSALFSTDNENFADVTDVEHEDGTRSNTSNSSSVDPGVEGSNLFESLSHFENLDLDDDAVLSHVWESLSADHRNLFFEQVESGVLTAQVGVWTPWWNHLPSVLQSLQLIQDTSKQYIDLSLVPESKYPSLESMVEGNKLLPMSCILKGGKAASIDVLYNSVNVILCYALCMVFYNGETGKDTHADEVCHNIISLCNILTSSQSSCSSTAQAFHQLADVVTIMSSKDVSPVTDITTTTTTSSSCSSRINNGHRNLNSNPSKNNTSIFSWREGTVHNASLVPNMSVDDSMLQGSCEDTMKMFGHPSSVLAGLLHVLEMFDDSLDNLKAQLKKMKKPTSQSSEQETELKDVLEFAKRTLKFAHRKVWFMCCWWNDIRVKVEDGRGLSTIKHSLTSIQESLSNELKKWGSKSK
eukprot:m.9725 g.9725  ORF g.9725 m.9725 type:complete len:493 (-) comp3534_c0_seq1:17-1495(-)